MEKHKNELTKLNINLNDGPGSKILYEEITQKRISIECSDFYKIVLKESQEEEHNKKSFTGIIVSETQLETGKYETEVKSTTTNEKKDLLVMCLSNK